MLGKLLIVAVVGLVLCSPTFAFGDEGGTGDRNDAQLANIDMQNMLQKRQQFMQMLSQISKMLHDTAMAVIRNMKG